MKTMMCSFETSWIHFAALVFAALVDFFIVVALKRVDSPVLEPTGLGVPPLGRKVLRL
jgi:hypothetical protein